MSLRRLPVVASLIVALTAAACASAPKPSADQSRPLAKSPQQAAIGFDKSSRTTDAESMLQFNCMTASTTFYNYSELRHPDQRWTATTTRAGSRWHVTVHFGDTYSSTETIYEVHRRPGGYCVSDVIGPGR